MIRRSLAVVEWHKFDGAAGNLTHNMPNEPALLFICRDDSFEDDVADGAPGWSTCLVEFASRKYPTINVNHGGLLGIIRNEEGDIIALTANNDPQGDPHA